MLLGDCFLNLSEKKSVVLSEWQADNHRNYFETICPFLMFIFSWKFIYDLWFLILFCGDFFYRLWSHVSRESGKSCDHFCYILPCPACSNGMIIFVWGCANTQNLKFLSNILPNRVFSKSCHLVILSVHNYDLLNFSIL